MLVNMHDVRWDMIKGESRKASERTVLEQKQRMCMYIANGSKKEQTAQVVNPYIRSHAEGSERNIISKGRTL